MELKLIRADLLDRIYRVKANVQPDENYPVCPISISGFSGLALLAVNTAVNDSEKKARAYWLKQGFVFPSGFDHDFEIGDAFGVRGVPTIFLIDSKGIVLYKQALVPENMEERLEQLLRRFEDEK